MIQTFAWAGSARYNSYFSERALIAITCRILAFFERATMPYEVKFSSNLRIIEAIVSGRLSTEDFHSCTNEQMDLSAKHGTGSFLINALELTSVALVTDVYDLPGRYKESGLSRSSRFALVLPKLQAVRKIAAFYDNVCTNRGWAVQTFAARDEAIAWLTNGEPS